jgi:RHS repeat-associated protein
MKKKNVRKKLFIGIVLVLLIASLLILTNFFSAITGNVVGKAADAQTSPRTTTASASESTTTYIYAGNLLASKTSGSNSTTYYLQDHLGSNIEVLENTTINQKSQFYVFGESNTTSKDNKYLYTGKELDYESGLYYYGARYYDPEIGRFIQADALTGGISDPLSMNRYSYVRNNPMIFVDPTGNKDAKFTLINILGQTVQKDVTSLSTNNLASGVYIAVVVDENGALITKDKLVIVDRVILGATAKTASGSLAITSGSTEIRYDLDLFLTAKSNDLGFKPNMALVNAIARSANVNDLLNPGEIMLHWTAAGDDGSHGTASIYDIRVSDKPILTEEDWNNAVRVTNEPVPQTAGTQENVVISGLVPGGRHYFALKTADEVGNWSPKSNTVGAKAKQNDPDPGDIGGGN